MATLTELLAQKAEIESAIRAQKTEAVAGIRAQMDQLGITVEDLVGKPQRSGEKRPVKYRDEHGNTWTGIGQRPRWLQKALANGATIEQFAIPKA